MDASMWDQRYEGAELAWSAEPNLFLPPLVEGLEPGRALDIACGEGRNAIWLARQGWEVTAVDFSPVGIEKAWQLSDGVEVEWVVADVTLYEPTTTFDLVVVFYLHVLPEDLAAVLQMATEALTPGGTLFAVGHAVRNMTDGHGGPQYPEILWDEATIAPMVGQLDVIELGERLRPIADADVAAVDTVLHATKRID
jgi:SAM-dependent methyltransferase